jgi:hypothetical protein
MIRYGRRESGPQVRAAHHPYQILAQLPGPERDGVGELEQRGVIAEEPGIPFAHHCYAGTGRRDDGRRVPKYVQEAARQDARLILKAVVERRLAAARLRFWERNVAAGAFQQARRALADLRKQLVD